jgi:hypothetical protein
VPFAFARHISAFQAGRCPCPYLRSATSWITCSGTLTRLTAAARTLAISCSVSRSAGSMDTAPLPLTVAPLPLPALSPLLLLAPPASPPE